MPLPAGTGLSRRSLLMRSAGLALSVYGGSRLSPGAFEAGVAEAATEDAPELVSVFVEGGIDSMSVCETSGDGRYRKVGPRLPLPASACATFVEGDPWR